MGKPKFFVLDTNVLLHNPDAIYLFDDNFIIIPISVIEEIDRFKRDQSELGRNARQISRILDELRGEGRLIDGVPMPGTNGGTLRVVFASRELPSKFALSTHKPDNRILAAALEVQEEDRHKPQVVSSQIIRHVDDHHAQLVNRNRHGMMLIPGQTLYIMELTPAAYAALAANEAEKAAEINIIEVRPFGTFGRVYLGGEERDIMAGYGAAVAAIEAITGKTIETKKHE